MNLEAGGKRTHGETSRHPQRQRQETPPQKINTVTQAVAMQRLVQVNASGYQTRGSIVLPTQKNTAPTPSILKPGMLLVLAPGMPPLHLPGRPTASTRTKTIMHAARKTSLHISALLYFCISPS